MIKKIFIACLLAATGLQAFESASQCMKGRVVRTANYTVAPLETLHLSGVVYGPSITVWSAGWVKGSSDTGILCYVNGRPDGWNDNWPMYNMGAQHLKFFPMFPVEASFYGHASGGVTGATITMVASCLPDGASFAIFMASPGEPLIPAETILENMHKPAPFQFGGEKQEFPEIQDPGKNARDNYTGEEKQQPAPFNFPTIEDPGEKTLPEGQKKVEERFKKEQNVNPLNKFQQGFFKQKQAFPEERFGDLKITEKTYRLAQKITREWVKNNPDADIQVAFLGEQKNHVVMARRLINQQMFPDYEIQRSVYNPNNAPKFQLASALTSAPPDDIANKVYNDTLEATPPTEQVADKTSETSITNGSHDSGSYRKWKKLRSGWKQVKWPNNNRTPRQPAPGYEQYESDPLPGTPGKRTQSRTSNPPLAANPEKNEKFTDEARYAKWADVEGAKYQLYKITEKFEPYEVIDVMSLRDGIEPVDGWSNSNTWYMDWYGQNWSKKRKSEEYKSHAVRAANYVNTEIIYAGIYGNIIDKHTWAYAQNILAPGDLEFTKMEESIHKAITSLRTKNANHSISRQHLMKSQLHLNKLKEKFPQAEFYEYDYILEKLGIR